MYSSVLMSASSIRINLIASTSDVVRNKFAQHLTPPEVASLAASMFNFGNRRIKCLDLGGGTGMLSSAIIDKFGNQIVELDNIELDKKLASIYEKEIRKFANGKTVLGDVITDTSLGKKRYDAVILNPPYKKMSAKDYRQALLPANSPNLYTAFIMIGIKYLEDNGQLVAIIPRSWMNGEYFIPFRKYLLSKCSLDFMHIYGSRSEVFSDTNVLQETMIIRITKSKKQSQYISVGKSNVKGDESQFEEFPSCSLISESDKIIRIAPQVKCAVADTIEHVGICPSTGKIVDFRSREYITFDKPKNCDAVPLIYVGNFVNGVLHHPLSFKKGQWFALNDDWARKQLCPPGAYVIVKRFSSKEEKRRVVAYPLIIKKSVALENHSTFLHQGKPRSIVPLRSADLAYGLSIWLNSTFIDEWFRDVSGSTQVNASDIRKMPCLQLIKLEDIGKSWHSGMTQNEIDKVCRREI